MNFARDFVDAVAPERVALVEIDARGQRREWSFARLRRLEAALCARMREAGVGRGDIVMTVLGSRPEWVAAMVACFRLGAVATPCSEQLRAGDLRLRLAATNARLVVADERDAEQVRGARPSCPVLWIGDPAVEPLRDADPEPADAVELEPEDPCLIVFTSGTTGKPRGAVHAQRYLDGQRLQAEHWFGARPGELAWCTTASGWSKSARNVFIAPWLCGAAALLHDARFDPAERLAIAEREGVGALCMAPTEYRIIAQRGHLRPVPGLRQLVAAGEALDVATIEAWRAATGLEIRDGYGQTETGAITANPPDVPIVAGSIGSPLPGVRAWIDDGELVVDPRTVPTFFTGYLGEPPVDRAQPWRTGDRVAERDGRLFFQTRGDDVIISAGYRIGPEEVEAVLRTHDAVADAAVIGVADAERGQVVKAVVQLADGRLGDQGLADELIAHCKAATAPYKQPRIVEFTQALPRTTSGKVRRAQLRDAD